MYHDPRHQQRRRNRRRFEVRALPHDHQGKHIPPPPPRAVFSPGVFVAIVHTLPPTVAVCWEALCRCDPAAIDADPDRRARVYLEVAWAVAARLEGSLRKNRAAIRAELDAALDAAGLDVLSGRRWRCVAHIDTEWRR